MNKGRILVVDDEPDLREILEVNLEGAGYEVNTASSKKKPSTCSARSTI